MQVSQATVNGIATRVGNRSFAAAVPLQRGDNALTVLADTSLGRVTRVVNVIRQEPSVTITSVSDGQTIVDDAVTLVGTAHGPAHAAVSINGQLATLASNGTFFIDNFPLDEGANSIVVSINTLHNLFYYQELMRELRAAIEEGTLAEVSRGLLEDRKRLL